MFLCTEFRDCFSLNTKDKHITSVEQLITIMRSLAFSPTIVEAQKYFHENHKGSSLCSSDLLLIFSCSVGR